MGYYRNNYQGMVQGAYQANERCLKVQRHVHEVQGSVKTADEDDPHQHRFCTTSEEAIPYGKDDHIHEVCFRTDTFDEHHHEFKGKTGCAIPVGGGKHVHFLESVTSVNDGHRHKFEVATLIENPTGMEHKEHCDHDHMDNRRY